MRIELDSPLYEPYSLVGHTPIAQLKQPVLLALEGEDRVLHELEDLLQLLLLSARAQEKEEDAAKRAERDAAARRFWPDEQRAWLRARDLSDRRSPGATGPLLRARDIVQDEPYMRALIDTGVGPLTRKPFTSAQIEPVEWTHAKRQADNDVLHRLLVRAALDGFHARAQTLLDMRADPSYMPPLPGGDYGYSALMVAARGGDCRMLQVLLLLSPPRPPRWLGPDHYGGTPLIGVACVADLLPVADVEAMLRLLLEAKAAPEAYDRDGYTALARLVHRPTSDTLRLLECMHACGVRCVSQSHLDEPPHAPLAIAAATGREDVVHYLLTVMEADVFDGGAAVRQAVTQSPLMSAVAAGHAAVVSLLVDCQADPSHVDLQGNSAFHQAARYNHGPDVLNALRRSASAPTSFEAEDALDQRAIQSHNLEGQTALMVAVHHGHLRSARALLDMVVGDAERRLLVLAGDAKRRNTPLHRAASMGNLELLEELVRHVDPQDAVDALDRMGQSPLERALAQDEFDTALFLLERGARVTPRMLDAAVESLDDWRLSLLLEHVKASTLTALMRQTLAQTWLVYRYRLLGAAARDEEDLATPASAKKNKHTIIDALMLLRPPPPQQAPLKEEEAAAMARTLSVAVACGLRDVVERVLSHVEVRAVFLLRRVEEDALRCHVAAYNLDHAMLRALWSHRSDDLPLTARTERTERTPLCCALAQLARTLVGDHMDALDPVKDEALRLSLDDTASEARALVETRRALRFEAPTPVMLPLGVPKDGVETARLLLAANPTSARVEDARGCNAEHYWEVCVDLSRRFHQPSAFHASLLALGPLFPAMALRSRNTSTTTTTTTTTKRRRTIRPAQTP
jgi:ankyrin repeat protein